MINDKDVVYVDFDEMFDSDLLHFHLEEELRSHPLHNSQQLTVANSSENTPRAEGKDNPLSRSSSGLITTGLIDSLLASQSLPVAQTKKSRTKKKETAVRYIRNNPPSSEEPDTQPSLTPSASESNIAESTSMKETSNPSSHFLLSMAEAIQTSSLKPLITKEQFYKIRPKIPKISKNDPRRLYAAHFAKAYNSCDVEQIWEFLMNYCVPNALMIQRWVGHENYFNFPKYIEIRGIEQIAEYWFSRCVISPDMVFTLKETKLYVRSDGLSTVLSSFSINCTRLYDGELSDAIVVKSFMPESKKKRPSSSTLNEISTIVASSSEQNLLQTAATAVDSEKVKVSTEELLQIPQSLRPLFKSHSQKAESTDHLPPAITKSEPEVESEPDDDEEGSTEPTEQISNRVFDKMKTILLAHMAHEKKELLQRAANDTELTSYEGLRKKIEEEKILLDQQLEKIRLFEDEAQFHLHFMSSDDDEDEYEEDEEEEEITESGTKKKKKKRKLILPKDRSTTFLGTLTLHLNQDYKIRQLEITFALRQ